MSPKIVSIFSGCGGLDSGFHKANFQTIFATDIWDTACASFKINFPRSEVVCANIENIKFKKVLKKHKVVDGLVGGPPCPPFSKSRFYRKEKKRGIEDKDGYISLTNYFRALEELNPKFFVFENVHGFIYKPHKEALEFVKIESEKLGYRLTYKIVNTANYGIPQTRERFICVGVKKNLPRFVFPEETHRKSNLDNSIKLPWVTAGDVLSEIDFDLPEDLIMQAGSKHKDIMKLIPPGENYLFFTKERGHPNPIFKWRSRYWSFLLKLSPKRPSWTIQASQSNNMGPFHWKNRFLRIQEIKRLQSFDDSFTIAGNYREQWKQIGNAVPPLFAYKLADEINKQYFKI